MSWLNANERERNPSYFILLWERFSFREFRFLSLHKVDESIETTSPSKLENKFMISCSFYNSKKINPLYPDNLRKRVSKSFIFDLQIFIPIFDIIALDFG